MPFIGSRMNGNAICSKTLGIDGSLCDVGIIVTS
jgi:hypothetical protein